MVVSLPPTTKVEAKMYLENNAIATESYEGETSTGSQNTGPPQRRLRELIIDGEKIDKVM